MSFAMAEEAVNEVAEQVAEVAEKAADGRLRLDIGGNLLDAVLGYLVVFIGLSLLMCVVIIVGKIMVAKMKKPAAEPACAPAPACGPCGTPAPVVTPACGPCGTPAPVVAPCK